MTVPSKAVNPPNSAMDIRYLSNMFSVLFSLYLQAEKLNAILI